MPMQEIYKGETIQYDEDSNKWEWSDGNYSRATLKEARSAIDNAQKKKFERVPVLVEQGRYRGKQWKEATLTSVTEPTRYGVAKAWVSYSKNKREQVDLSNLVADTPENRALIAEIQEKNKLSNKLQEDAQDLEDKLTKPVVKVFQDKGSKLQ